MSMLAVGDTVWNTLITGVVAVVLALIGYRKLIHIEKVGKETHVLVNSNMGAQLRISAVALRTVATLQPTPQTVAAAELAEKLLQEHESKQASVDAMGTKL